MSTSKIILLTGGIGSGKSVVARCLRAMGQAVYDCDHEARRIMEDSEDIRRQLCQRVHPQAVGADGRLNRRLIADTVFADAERLGALNDIVHQAVRRDILMRAKSLQAQEILFVETAIPRASALDRLPGVEAIWQVEAPAQVRVERAMKRDGCQRAHVLARIQAQQGEEYGPDGSDCPATMCRILNDGITPLLPRLLQLLSTVGRN